jgi:hypothetical protein
MERTKTSRTNNSKKYSSGAGANSGATQGTFTVGRVAGAAKLGRWKPSSATRNRCTRNTVLASAIIIVDLKDSHRRSKVKEIRK